MTKEEWRIRKEQLEDRIEFNKNIMESCEKDLEFNEQKLKEHESMEEYIED